MLLERRPTLPADQGMAIFSQAFAFVFGVAGMFAEGDVVGCLWWFFWLAGLGRRQQIGNKEHCVSMHLVLAIENTQFSLCALARFLTEHKRSTGIDFGGGRFVVPDPAL